jgi:hypothetical protein
MVAYAEERVSRRGAQVLGGVFVEPCGTWTSDWLVEFGAGAVERVQCEPVVAPVGVDGGLSGGEPGYDDRGTASVLGSRGEVVERGGGEALGGGELRGVPVSEGGELAVAVGACAYHNGLTRQPTFLPRTRWVVRRPPSPEVDGDRVFAMGTVRTVWAWARPRVSKWLRWSAQVQVWATPATRYVSLAGSRSVSPHHPHRTAIGKSIKAHVKHQLGPACQESAGTTHSSHAHVLPN